MRQRRTRGGLLLCCLSFCFGASLVLLVTSFHRAPNRLLGASVHVSLRSHGSSIGSADPRPHAALQNRLPEAGNPLQWFLSRDLSKGNLPTQKIMQSEMLVTATKGRNRSGPVLGCEQFRSSNFTWPEGMQNVAVVGNGPLMAESRKDINAMDFVIRFNKLQSYVCGEKFDVWASRHGDAVSTRYWGIGQKLNVTGCPLERLLHYSKHIWLLNGGDGPFNFFLKSYPQIRDRARYLWIDCRKWVSQYLSLYGKEGISTLDEVSPSSGWLVIMMLKDCAPPGTKIHVYGFNWPGGQWPAHKVEEERDEIRALADEGILQIHQTECQHKYHCNGND